MEKLPTIATQPGAVIVADLPPDKNPAAVYLAHLKPTGRRVQAHALDIMAAWLNHDADAMTCNWPALTYAHTNAIRTRLDSAYAPATANRMLSALRGVLRECRRLKLMSGDDYTAAVDFEAIGGQNVDAPLPGRDLSPGEISALMNACMADPTAAGARDAAIIALMASTGLRREEVVSIPMSDYDPTTGRLLIHGKGRGRGGKLRTVYAVNGAADALADWLMIRGDAPGALFVAIDKAGQITRFARMTNQTIYNMLEKRAQEADISASFSPHDLRRTAITALLDAGADLGTVSKIAGHTDPRITQKYDRRGEAAKVKAQSMLHVPYKRRQIRPDSAPETMNRTPGTGQAPNVKIRPVSAR